MPAQSNYSEKYCLNLIKEYFVKHIGGLKDMQLAKRKNKYYYLNDFNN